LLQIENANICVQESLCYHCIFSCQVSFDVAWSPDCVDGRCYDYKGIADAVDFLVIMAYDQQSQIKEGPCIAKANSPYQQTIDGKVSL